MASNPAGRRRRRLLEEINALEIERTGGTSHKLTRGQRNLLLLRLKDKRKVAYESLRKSLKLDPEDRFNKEKDDRKEMTRQLQELRERLAKVEGVTETKPMPKTPSKKD